MANELLPGLEEAALAGGAVVTNAMRDIKEVRPALVSAPAAKNLIPFGPSSVSFVGVALNMSSSRSCS